MKLNTIYFNNCRCGELVGVSGWSHSRWVRFYNLKYSPKCSTIDIDD